MKRWETDEEVRNKMQRWETNAEVINKMQRRKIRFRGGR